jgi:hypothetical protein
VRLHITHGKTTHVLEACLTPEDARSYRIDGKIRTGAQVKVCPHCCKPDNVSTVRSFNQHGLFAPSSSSCLKSTQAADMHVLTNGQHAEEAWKPRLLLLPGRGAEHSSQLL